MTTPMGVPIAAMAQGLMGLTVTTGISGTPIGGHTIPIMYIEFMEDHRRLPMSHPWLPSLEFLMRNRNPLSPSPDLEVYQAPYNIIFKNSESFIKRAAV